MSLSTTKNSKASEHQIFKKARDFAEAVVAPRSILWERESGFDRETLRDAAKLGLIGLQVPATHGGLGLPFSAKTKLAEILAGADFGFAMSVMIGVNVAFKLTRDTSSKVVNRYLSDLLTTKRLASVALTEPQAGTDFSSISMSAVRTDDGWILNGEKSWIVNGAESDLIIVFAQTEPGSRGAGIAAFLVDGRREGFTRTSLVGIPGQTSIGVGGFVLKDYCARNDELMLPAGTAFKNILNDINGARTYVAAMCCGMMNSAIRIVTDYGQSRQTFGRALSQHQGWGWSLAEAEIDLTAARLLVKDAAARIDDGANCRFEAAQAKVFATRMALRHIPALCHLMGAEGLRNFYPFGRHMTGARISGLVDGTTEILLEALAGRHRMKQGGNRK